ncbi:GNAT family N-acetyltransferase [Microbulbifer hainanensis]|uniref:GNAT family N-acetyltransferase n=1 Tax=Microbulbifer hainanensis TaxID=2735675 RepID=UPI0029C06751|nr:GNAT family N-acetyltransferase [Microbulbifer hainanensis]
MSEAKLEVARDTHLPIVMSWIQDREQCVQWGGPNFRYPFDAQSFVEDCRWGDLASFVLANASGELFAFGQYYNRLDRCHLGRLIVSPHQRGAGYGQQLVAELAEHGCRELGLRETSLFVLKDNPPARGLYQKLGFQFADYPEQQEWLSWCDYMVAPAGAFSATE